MPLIYQKFIKRCDLEKNRGVFYVFGDNIQRVGTGGQAREMRGEPNAIGIPTKRSPTEYFNAHDEVKSSVAYEEICKALSKVLVKLQNGKIVVWPSDGVGTGLARLQQHAPRLYDLIQSSLKYMEEAYSSG